MVTLTENSAESFGVAKRSTIGVAVCFEGHRPLGKVEVFLDDIYTLLIEGPTYNLKAVGCFPSKSSLPNYESSELCSNFVSFSFEALRRWFLARSYCRVYRARAPQYPHIGLILWFDDGGGRSQRYPPHGACLRRTLLGTEDGKHWRPCYTPQAASFRGGHEYPHVHCG